MTTYLKVLSPDNLACHGGEFDYTDYLPQGDEPGPWLPDREPVLCQSGWHWCTPASLMQCWAKPHMRVYEAEPPDDVTACDEQGKCVSSSGRLVREYPLPDWWLDAMQFVTEEISAIPWMQRIGPVDPAWRVYPTGAAARDAARAAAWDAVWVTARDAARDAARAAAWDAARVAAWDTVWDTARDAVWTTAWATAWVAAWDTAWDTARDAVWDTALYACIQYVAADLPLDQPFRDLADARMEVWRRGYGLCGVFDDVLYVYEAVA